MTPARLLSLLDKAKAYNLFLAQEPDAVAGVLYDRPARVCEYPNFRVRIEETFRFEEDDTIVFNVSLINDTDQPIFYDPQGFGGSTPDGDLYGLRCRRIGRYAAQFHHCRVLRHHWHPERRAQ